MALDLDELQLRRLDYLAQADYRNALELRIRMARRGQDTTFLDTEELPLLGELINVLHESLIVPRRAA